MVQVYTVGNYKVEGMKVYGWDATVFSVWAPVDRMIGGSYQTYTTIDGETYGRLGTERLTPELEALKPMTNERFTAVKAFHTANYLRAYQIIEEAVPGISTMASARLDMGQIEANVTTLADQIDEMRNEVTA